jgi:hypothetical protein
MNGERPGSVHGKWKKVGENTMGENGSPSFKVLHRINVLDILTWFVFNIFGRSRRLYKAIYRIAKMRSLSVKGVTCKKYNID